MKILVFSPYYPPHIGGLESHSDEFNKHLSKKGGSITVFTPHLPETSPKSEMLYGGVSVIRFPAFELIHNYPVPKFWKKEFWEIWHKLLSEKEYDLVISRTRFFFPSLMAGSFARKKKLRWVHIEHGSDFAQFKSKTVTKIGEFYDRTFGKFILQHADTLIANSQASCDFVHRLAKNSSCQVIYRGVESKDLILLKPDEALRTMTKGKIVIGFVGRLISGKGVSDLLYAFAALKRNDCVCVIVGDGPEKASLEKLAEKLQIETSVYFFGHKSFREAMSLLKAFDIFVNPSYTEGIPTSVIEAAFCQKAIIATIVGGTKEIINGDGDGFLVEPKNIPQLTEKLSLFASDSNVRITSGAKAFEAVKDRFDWEKTAEEYLKIFNSKNV